MRIDPHTVAEALGGEVHGNIVRAPGPGQKPTDRSLKVKVDPNLSDGFTVTDFYGSVDWRHGKDYVRERLGEPAWDDRNPKVDYVAIMNARAMGSDGPHDFNTAPPQREKRSYPGDTEPDEPKLGPIGETYDYTDLDGTLLYQVTRHDPKAFRQRRPDGNGGWVDDDHSTKRVLYRWPDVARFPDVPVFICEGEKDADRLASFGYCATTVAAGDWQHVEYSSTLKDREVIILADNDFPGRKRAYATYLELDGAETASVRVVALPGLPPGGDVSDWLDANPTRADTLLEVCRTAPEPHWPPLPSRNDDRFVAKGDEGPAVSSSEKRRHFYRQYNPEFQDHCCISAPVKIKVMKKGDKDPYITFRVYDEVKGTTGWQFKTPDGFENVPYFVPDRNPFSGEARQLPLYWTEGEKDTDTLAALGLAAFTFGGGDGLPRGCEEYIAGRHVIITADNDEGGRKQARAKAVRAMAVAASVKLIQFTNDDVKEKGDVSDWIEGGHSLEDLRTRVETTEHWKKPEQANDESAGTSGITNDGADTPPGIDAPSNARKPIRATPYNWKDPATIPQRDWLYGRLLLRKFVTATISPGGIGKSSLIAAEALAMVSGKDLLGVRPDERLRVWLWNLEDPQEETERKIQAAAIHYHMSPDDIGDRLLVDSGRDQRLVIAVTERNGAVIVQPVVDDFVAEIIARKIDVIVIDPFVSCHEVAENDNPAMDRVVKEWGKVADRGNCAVHLVDHTRKMGDATEVTTESSRGGSAKTDACRVVRVVNRMSERQAADAGVDNHRLYFRTYNDKGNLQPPADGSDWFKLESVDLGNGPMGLPGDSVGVVTRWDWPDLTVGMTAADYDRVAAVIKGGKWKASIQAKNWAGNGVAEALGLNTKDADDKAKIKAALKMYLKAGTLVEVERLDSERREMKLFVEVPEKV